LLGLGGERQKQNAKRDKNAISQVHFVTSYS